MLNQVYSKILAQIICHIQINILTTKTNPQIILTKIIITKIKIDILTTEIGPTIKSLMFLFGIVQNKETNKKNKKF